MSHFSQISLSRLACTLSLIWTTCGTTSQSFAGAVDTSHGYELRGIAKMDDDWIFSLHQAEHARSFWTTLDQSAYGVQPTNFDSSSKTLTLLVNGHEIRIQLAKPSDTPFELIIGSREEALNPRSTSRHQSVGTVPAGTKASNTTTVETSAALRSKRSTAATLDPSNHGAYQRISKGSRDTLAGDIDASSPEALPSNTPSSPALSDEPKRPVIIKRPRPKRIVTY